MLTRLDRIRPFVLTEPMLPAAALHPAAQLGIERYLAQGRGELRQRAGEYRSWLQGEGRQASPELAHRRFAYLRLRFNTVLNQLDMFSDIVCQRSESDHGVWLAGLDAFAKDALAMPDHYVSPPVACYLDRGMGAAIRRARTRLPGGGLNPVAVIRIPRERMVGSGIASSLVHEVGHQACGLLGLVRSVQADVEEMGRRSKDRQVWQLWARWISEVLADFWSVARLGITATLGLMGVVGLPRAFVFRVNEADPHPAPWIRVLLSAGMGRSLYPHTQWDEVTRRWRSYYPLDGLSPERQDLLQRLERSIPDLCTLLLEHRCEAVQPQALGELVTQPDRTPERLQQQFDAWQYRPQQAYQARPTLVFAVLGQARARNQLSPEAESSLLQRLLEHWAMTDKFQF